MSNTTKCLVWHFHVESLRPQVLCTLDSFSFLLSHFIILILRIQWRLPCIRWTTLVYINWSIHFRSTLSFLFPCKHCLQNLSYFSHKTPLFSWLSFNTHSILFSMPIALRYYGSIPCTTCSLHLLLDPSLSFFLICFEAISSIHLGVDMSLDEGMPLTCALV